MRESLVSLSFSLVFSKRPRKRRTGVVPVFGAGGSSKEGFLCVSVQFNREDGSGSSFGSWKTVLAVPLPRSVPGKTVPTVPVSGSGSVPGPPCNMEDLLRSLWGFGGRIFRSCPQTSQKLPLYVEISICNAFWGNFLEVCFRTPGTCQKLLQKSALRCIRLCSVLTIHGSRFRGPKV